MTRRQQACEKNTPEIIDACEIIVEHDPAGDPITGLTWTRKTTEKIAEVLQQIHIPVSANTVARLLYQMDFSLRQPQADRHQLQPLSRSAIPTYLLPADSLSATRSSDHQRR